MKTLFFISEELKDAVKGFEGYCPVATNKLDGVWTIGYGHTGGVKRYQSTTRKEAEEWLVQDLSKASRYVNGLQVCKTQGQFDALVDFCYNLGTGRLAGSTLLKYIRAGKPTSVIQEQFRRWVYSGGKKLDGLVKRRNWEAKRWAE